MNRATRLKRLEAVRDGHGRMIVCRVRDSSVDADADEALAAAGIVTTGSDMLVSIRCFAYPPGFVPHIVAVHGMAR